MNIETGYQASLAAHLFNSICRKILTSSIGWNVAHIFLILLEIIHASIMDGIFFLPPSNTSSFLTIFMCFFPTQKIFPCLLFSFSEQFIVCQSLILTLFFALFFVHKEQNILLV